MKSAFNITTFLLSFSLISGFTFAAQNNVKVITTDEIKWGYLNPLRGVLSPGAADLWGDRTANVATGMLVRFKKGFESPPHIHNITYRGIVIEGLLHNDDPTSQKMWMPTGSFWTQPAGENHTTAANAQKNMIYLEIESGPYLVKPANQQFDNGERPLNLHRDNIVWLNSSDLHNIEAKGVQSTYLWGNTQEKNTLEKNTQKKNGSMIKLPAGFKGTITSAASEFRAVVIAGAVEYRVAGSEKAQTLQPASYVESIAESAGTTTHHVANHTNADAIVYIRTNAPYTVQ